MKKLLFPLWAVLAATPVFAQDIKSGDVPGVVKTALAQKYPQATRVSWEKEKGNYEANWGGKSGEDHSVQFSPSGVFVESVDNIPVSTLPTGIGSYVTGHYKTRIKEAGKRMDAGGQYSYEVEIKGKDLIFGLDGTFMKEEVDAD